jgi:Na+-transporting methylmalonyl-CoA/oxaloacetate decarboxylase gamma subunit
MENPLVTTLTVTLIGMGVVFAAMGLILGSMALLTRLARPTKMETHTSQDQEPSSGESAARPMARRSKLRAAAVAVAMVRARERQESEERDVEPQLTPWGDYHRQRQLRPSGRGRIA